MFVLHAHWQPGQIPSTQGQLLFWAETDQVPEPSRLNPRRRSARPHPFAAPAETVQTLLAQLSGLAVKPTHRELVLELPAGRNGPRPSPALVHTWELGDDELHLLPWQIPACAMGCADSLLLLQQLPTPAELPHEIRLGSDLRFWQTASHLVLELLAQQKLLPMLVSGHGRRQASFARWQPVLDSPRDGTRLAQLRDAMPPICRSGADDDHASPSALLASFLDEATDALARRWSQLPTAWVPLEPAQAWLQALGHGSAQTAVAGPPMERLAASHRAWMRGLSAAGDAHFRVALRLEAPDQQGEPGTTQWTLHFLLQARDDPSLLIPAPQIWQSRSGTGQALERRLANPQELLLTGLGFTARLFEPLRRSLEEMRPSSTALTNSEAFAFLREVAPLLEESGFGVLVPPWWNQPGMRLGVRLRMGSQATSDGVAAGLVSLERLVNYRWEVALGGETLSREEFAALADLKAPLVQLRGQWVQLDPAQVEAAIRFWEKMDREGEIGLLDAMQMGVDRQEVAGLPVEEVSYDGWLQQWMERFTQRTTLEPLPQPATLQATLRPYQRYGYSWLEFQRRWGIGACLADDMGLGKTIQALTQLLHVQENGGLPGPVLLICPTSVVLNWAQEAGRFAPSLSLLIHQGVNRLQGDELIAEARRSHLVLTSYALIRRDGETLKEIDWFGVFLDEAQNIKNAQTKQARLIRQLTASFRLALTGTPIENRLAELWSIMQFLNPGFLGSQQQFRQRFAIPIERYDDTRAAHTLRQLTSPFILRRVKADPTVIQDLPDKQETKAFCTLTAEQASLYEAVVQNALQAIAGAESIQRRGLVLSMLMQLKQICNHPAQYLHQIGDSYSPDRDEARSGKLARLVELLDELLAVGDRALIFTQFAEMGRLLRSYLQQRCGVQTLFLYGGTPIRQRAEMVERFQADGDGPPLFILSLKAGGTGLNLTRANHVFHFDRWWNPAVEDQATDRAFRIGQRQNVQVHKFVCVGTLEEKIDAMIEAKKALAASIVSSGENWLTELSNTDLQELVALRHEFIE